MKTLRINALSRKSLVLLLMVMTSFGFVRAQVSNDFESGNREIDKNNCWQFISTSISTSDKISGSFSMRSGPLSGGLHSLITPWIGFSGSATISFKHKMNLSNGTTRVLNVYLIRGNEEIVSTIFTYNYVAPFNTLKEETLDLDVTGDYRIMWEWAGSGGTSRAVMDDVMINPGEYRSDPTTNPGWGDCSLISNEPDTDGDGVIDAEDDYPEDPYRAYDNVFPEEGWGTVAFEDLWPATGDYDFNDLVVDFKLAAVTNAENYVTEFKGIFRTRAIGASFHNAFGFQLGKVPAASVLKVTNSFGGAYANRYFRFNENGVEAEQDEAVIIVFDDAFRVLPHPGDGQIGVNTSPKGIYVEPFEIEVIISMLDKGKPAEGFEPINLYDYAAEYVNMFMVVKANEGRGREVHLPGYPPTMLADSKLFGTLDDDTRPEAQRFYVSTNNYPWGMLFVSQYDYPIEKVDIVKAYNHFAAWAESGGEKYPDWFIDKPGYRNPELIYKK